MRLRAVRRFRQKRLSGTALGAADEKFREFLGGGS